MTIYLASSSQARFELLTALGYRVEAIAGSVREEPRPAETAAELVRRLAADKLNYFLQQQHPLRSPRVILAADTVIECDGKIFGKPADRAAARQTLIALAGQTHLVHTGMALQRQGSPPLLFNEQAEVRLTNLNSVAIEAYLDKEEWRNVAGGYRLQGSGASLIEWLAGEPATVVGLPCRLLRSLLAELECCGFS